MKNNRSTLSIRGNCTPRPKFLGALKKRKPERLTEQLRSFVMNNVLSVIWSSVLALGGIFFLVYFWSIQFFPVLNLSSVAALLAAMSITGLGLVVLLAFYLVFPGWLWREVICEMKEIKPLLLNEGGDRQHVLLLHSLPMAMAAAALLNWSHGYSWCWVLLFLSPFIVALWMTINDLNKFLKLIPVAIANGFIFVCTSWFLVLLFASTNKSVSNNSELLSWLFLLEMTLLALLVNYLIASLNKIKWWFIYFAAISLLILLLLISGQPSMVQQAAMRFLKLGNIENAELVLDQQGCKIVEQFLVSSVSVTTVKNPSIEASKYSSSSEICRVPSINILSRIGEEYYLEQSNKSLQFVIPSSHVLSWSVSKKMENK